MKKLLSLPESLSPIIHELEGLDPAEWFAASDPDGQKIGSGGGTAHLLAEEWKHSTSGETFDRHLSRAKRAIIHAGGQSRRLPGYAPSGKILTPLPVFRWSRGQRIDQNLLDLQLPLLERLMTLSSPRQNTLVASGDVLIVAPALPAELPDVDVVCVGLWVDPQVATRHGVFFSPKNDSTHLQFMLQKPTHKTVETLGATSLFQMDSGLWILSDKAVRVLMARCGWKGDSFAGTIPNTYDLYSQFGTALGSAPSAEDPEIAELTVALLPLEGATFHHFGTSLELITSLGHIQSLVQDQRQLLHNRVKPHPTLFTQNALTSIDWQSHHHHIWIENSFIPATWQLSDHHVITGVPPNQWELKLAPGICLDVIPVGDDLYCLRPYGIRDTFSGNPNDRSTLWMGGPVANWLEARGLSAASAGIAAVGDLQKTPLFPILSLDDLGLVAAWMTAPEGAGGAETWVAAERLSADQISQRANLTRLYAQRDGLRQAVLPLLAENHRSSVFYQIDLKHLASEFARSKFELPAGLSKGAHPSMAFQEAMFRAEFARRRGLNGDSEERRAFEHLRHALIGDTLPKAEPRLGVQSDQIVWGRSPARLDLAGGWSDTPPFCIQSGGQVVNLAVNLNGQPPLQVFLRPSTKSVLTLRSIDLGVVEEIVTYEDLNRRDALGSAFSIPKVALVLAGFRAGTYPSLTEQLRHLGCGIEMTLLSAIPKGSGLGTSSILAGTILGALSDFCQLGWGPHEIGHRTLILEQLLTSGGGWQDQYGGILPGVKLLESDPGPQDRIRVRWASDRVFAGENRDHWLLYYTGITRVAQTILSEIVAGMFLNENARLAILNDIKAHAGVTFSALERCDLEATGRALARSWHLNKALDSGTTSTEIDALVARVDDLCHGLKLLGAGGGGYLLMCAKDRRAAGLIRDRLNASPPNSRARFVDMSLSTEGFQVSRS